MSLWKALAMPVARPARQVRPAPSTWVAIVGFIATSVTLVLTHRFVIPRVVRGIGTAVGHHEIALRAAGWLLGGGAWLVGGALVFFWSNLARHKLVLGVLIAWILVNLPFLPARSESSGGFRRMLGPAYSDGRYFLLGVGGGLLGALAAIVGDLFIAGLVRGHGPFRAKSRLMFGALAGWYFLATAGGLAFAMLRAAPTYR
jgi:hypothetical protein